MQNQRTVITFGTYDLFHFGHLRILERSAEKGTRLVVGVSSDALNFKKKQIYPAIDEEQRMAIVRSLKCVDHVFLEESLELKKHYCEKYGADVLVMGDDHLNEYNEMLKDTCECEYLPRTEGVSSTAIKKQISSSDSLMNRYCCGARCGIPAARAAASSSRVCSSSFDGCTSGPRVLLVRYTLSAPSS